MSISRLLVTLGAVLLTAACATAPAVDDATQAEAALGEAVATADASAATGDQEVECREELRTGTNFKRRVCLTKAEWAAQGRGQRRESSEVIRTRTEREAVTGGATAGPPTANFP